jgi:hypothetical protein
MRPLDRMSRAPAIRALLPSMCVAVALAGSAFAVGTLSAHPFEPSQQVGQPAPERFPHSRHARLFPLCTGCHAGVLDTAQSIWPQPSQCAACHDDVVKPRITWQSRIGPRAGNRRFTHQAHTRAVTAKNPADSALIRNCEGCHVERGAPRMNVRNAVVSQCIDCHGYDAPHVDVPNEACATCHVRITDAPGLTREDIARFPKPQSHRNPGFVLGGHGKQAKGPGESGTLRAVSANCATCHAQNFCVSCHVNAPELPQIRALAVDARSPAYSGRLPAPPTHATPAFLRTHGRDARRPAATCTVCHARESCATCHVGSVPRAVAALPPSGPGRAAGVHVVRTPPPSHTRDFRDRHASEANATPKTCETCHVRDMCLECHRPEAARQSETARRTDVPKQSTDALSSTAQSVGIRAVGPRRSGYHPPSFLTRHPSSAYTREANCSDCHNSAQFCQSCHQQSGVVSKSRIGQRGYHDAFRGFSLGHGQAARQSLESCASCHAERDCTACHSAVSGGFRFNPHGPGFNADRMKAKNPSLCRACHGNVVP